jgi:hypothetical protein
MNVLPLPFTPKESQDFDAPFAHIHRLLASHQNSGAERPLFAEERPVPEGPVAESDQGQASEFADDDPRRGTS